MICNSAIVFFDLEFIKEVITALIGAGIGTVTAVVIFIRTNKKEKEKEQLKKDLESKNRLLYTGNLIKSFKEQLDDSIKSLSALIIKFTEDPIKFHLQVIAINESSSLLNEMLKSEKTFISHNEIFGVSKIKHYNNLRNEVAFFEIQMKQLSDMSIRAKDYDFHGKKELFELINHIMRNLIKINDIQGISEQYCLEIFRFSVEFEKKLTDKTDVRFYHENYLNPLLHLLLVHSNDETVFGIISQIKSSMIIYQHIEANNKVHLANLENIYKEMNQLVKNLETDSMHIINEN